MNEARPDLAIRRFIAQNDEWTRWLANFPFLPAESDWHLDYFLKRSGPWLRQMPSAQDLTFAERADLRALFIQYAGRVTRNQQRTIWRGRIDTALTWGGVFASAAINPFLGGITLVIWARNIAEDTAWKYRRAALISLADYIEKLL